MHSDHIAPRRHNTHAHWQSFWRTSPLVDVMIGWCVRVCVCYGLTYLANSFNPSLHVTFWPVAVIIYYNCIYLRRVVTRQYETHHIISVRLRRVWNHTKMPRGSFYLSCRTCILVGPPWRKRPNITQGVIMLTLLWRDAKGIIKAGALSRNLLVGLNSNEYIEGNCCLSFVSSSLFCNLLVSRSVESLSVCFIYLLPENNSVFFSCNSSP